MELQFYGANCMRLSYKKVRFVVDDNLSSLGLKTITKNDDISLYTSTSLRRNDSKFTIDMPGEYEISGVVIRGIAAQGHMEEENNKGSTIYSLNSEDLKVVVIGHIAPKLSEEQLESIGLADVAVIPVGGNGYTLDGVEALQVIKQMEPRAIIPTHYADKALKYEVPQQELSEAIKALGMEPQETVAKYKPQKSGLTDTAHLVILERQ